MTMMLALLAFVTIAPPQDDLEKQLMMLEKTLRESPEGPEAVELVRRLREQVERRGVERIEDLTRRVRRNPEDREARAELERLRRRMEPRGPRPAPKPDPDEMKKGDPEGFKMMEQIRAMEERSHRLAEEIREAPPQERKERKAELKTLLGELFDLREEARQRELGALKKRVGELEKKLERRKALKAEIVGRRQAELLGERDELDW